MTPSGSPSRRPRGLVGVPDEQLLALVRAGQTLLQVGELYGVTRERVRQRLHAAGVRAGDLRTGRCDYCGARLRSVRDAPTLSGTRACLACKDRQKRDADTVRRRREREARLAAVPRARCHHCGGPMVWAVPRDDGRPSFCQAKPCKSARTRWYHDHDPVYREYQRRLIREQYHRRKRGGPVTVKLADVARELGIPRPVAPPRWGAYSASRTLQGPEADRARKVLALKGFLSERKAAVLTGVARSTVNGIWRGVRWGGLQREAQP